MNSKVRLVAISGLLFCLTASAQGGDDQRTWAAIGMCRSCGSKSIAWSYKYASRSEAEDKVKLIILQRHRRCFGSPRILHSTNRRYLAVAFSARGTWWAANDCESQATTTAIEKCEAAYSMVKRVRIIDNHERGTSWQFPIVPCTAD